MTSNSQRSSQEQFGRLATRYTNSTAHTGNNNLADLKDFIGTEGERYHIAVDIGTGPGFTAFSIAPHCDYVIATDVTPQMLEEVRRLRHERQAPYTQMALVAAEALPFADSSVDLVTSRTAAHHFVNLTSWLRETARVLRPGGCLTVCDTCAPEDLAVAEWMHAIEIARDTSHVRNLAPAEWLASVEAAGLQVTYLTMSHVYLQWPDWAERAGMGKEASAALRHEMLNAPDAAREAFSFAENPDGTIDFHWDVITIGAIKPLPY